MYTIEDIRNFIATKTGLALEEVTEEGDINRDLGCSGDDFNDLMEAYSRSFNVDMRRYLWYFHHAEEGQNFGGMFFKSPDQRVKHLPVTARLLLEFANKGFWDFSYPEHRLPRRRYDLLINMVMVLLLLAYIIYRCTR